MLDIEKIKPLIIYGQYPHKVRLTENAGKASYHHNTKGNDYYPHTLTIERSTYTLVGSEIHPDKSWATYTRDILVIKV